MPIFPQRKISLYYIVEIDIISLLGFLNIVAPINSNISTPADGVFKFFATKFEVTQSSELQSQLYIQGKPGTLVHAVPTALYTYEIECPLLTTIANPSGFTYQSDFAPYNSLTLLAVSWLNWQWQFMQDYSSKMGDFPAILESFEIDFNATQGLQKLKIVSNILLNSYIQAQFVGDITNPSQSPTPTPINYPPGARLLKNYDVATDMLINVNGVQFGILAGSNQFVNINFNVGNTALPPVLINQTPVYIESARFNVQFEYEKKNVINSIAVQDINGQTYPAVAFWLKNYKVNQIFGIVGQEAVVSTEIFSGGDFFAKESQIVMNVFQGYTNEPFVLYSFILPFMVKSKTETINADSLIKTNLDFSFNGTQYSADASMNFGDITPPTITGQNVLIYSDLV